MPFSITPLLANHYGTFCDATATATTPTRPHFNYCDTITTSIWLWPLWHHYDHYEVMTTTATLLRRPLRYNNIAVTKDGHYFFFKKCSKFSFFLANFGDFWGLSQTSISQPSILILHYSVLISVKLLKVLKRLKGEMDSENSRGNVLTRIIIRRKKWYQEEHKEPKKLEFKIHYQHRE